MIGSTIVSAATTVIYLATPYLYASIGETFGQLSGVLNLGVEGVMLMGAYAAFFTVLRTGSLTLGLLVAAVLGGSLGLVMAFMTVTLKAEQVISGMGLYLFSLGLSEFLFKKTIGTVQTVSGFPPVNIPWFSSIPVIGEILFRQNVLVYIAFALVPFAWFVLSKTPFGLKVRAAGQNPEAADSLGINIVRVRYLALMIGGLLSGIAGASLSIALLNVFQPNITNGIGFIAVGLVFFANWRPLGILAGTLIFSTVTSLQLWMQVQDINIPSDFLSMIPYIAIILVFVSMMKRRVYPPAALTKPFERGE